MNHNNPLRRYAATLRWDAPGNALRRVVLDALTLTGGIVAVVLLVCLAVAAIAATVGTVTGGC